jgi:hypothetical protein
MTQTRSRSLAARGLIRPAAGILRPPPTDAASAAPYAGFDELDTDDMDAFRFALSRRIMTFLGFHRRCELSICRRAHRCMGEPLLCLRDLPKSSPEEQSRVLAELRQALRQVLAQREP